MELYQPRQQFMSLHMRSKRWACIVAHRRAGKTVAVIGDMITRALATKKENARYAYIAPFYGQAKLAAWDYLKRYSEPVRVKVWESDLQVELKNGARIRLYGADNPDAMRGGYLDGATLDEFGDMKPSVWGSVVRPMLADRNGWGTFIGTPKGRNQFYDINRLSKLDPDWYHLTLRASESGLLLPSELIDARKMMSDDEYEREFECSFEAAIAGAIYGKWMGDAHKENRITKVPYDKRLPVYTAWDLGYSDTTSIWFFQVAYNEIRLIDYYENNQEGIPHYCQMLKERPYRYGKHYVPQDAGHELMAAGGRSIVQQANDLGIKMFVVNETSHSNAHEAVRVTLPICWFDAEHCDVGIESLKQYQFEYDEEKKMYKKKPRHDWTSHASRAFDIIARVWKEPKTSTTEQRPRFLHETTANEVFWPKVQNSTNNQRI